MFSGKMECGAHSSDNRELEYEVHGKRQKIELLTLRGVTLKVEIFPYFLFFYWIDLMIIGKVSKFRINFAVCRKRYT